MFALTSEQEGEGCPRRGHIVTKRPRSSPNQCTPERQQKRVPLRELANNDGSRDGSPLRLLPSRLTYETENAKDESHRSPKKTKEEWSDSELKALTEFVLFHTSGDTWPSHKQAAFWKSASQFLKNRGGMTNVCRSASACRSKVTLWLAKRYKSPKDAEAFYSDNFSPVPRPQVNAVVPVAVLPSGESVAVQTEALEPSTLIHLFSRLPVETHLQVLSRLFTSYVSAASSLTVPDDFLCHAAAAIVHLHENGRTNVLYNLAKGIGTFRPDKTDTRFPIKQMPMGLVEYIAQFFAADNLQKIRCPPDYRSWQQTMYSHFGHKWLSLHCGPMWSIVSRQDSDSVAQSQHTMEALVNIPAISNRTIRRDIATSKTTVDSRIQASVLDEAAKSTHDTWWWLKADGCDITKGLKESTKMLWSGDVDLADGSLQKQYEEYRKRLKTVEMVALSRQSACRELEEVLCDVKKDLQFIHSELAASNNRYSEKMMNVKHSEQELINLAWKVKELSELNEMGRKLYANITQLIAKINHNDAVWEVENVPCQLSIIRKDLVIFIKGVTRHQRTAATHVLVFMISSEERRKKPYALPVQCLPYKGLADSTVRQLANKIIQEMSKRQMKVAGFVTDGEWNSLRTKGNTRPLSVLQIRADVRAKYSRMGFKTMSGMIMPLLERDGRVVARVRNPAVNSDLLREVYQWNEEGATIDDVIERLRLRTVPPKYVGTIHTWIDGKDETRVEKLRSLLAQLEYKYLINDWHSKGVPFKDHLYVPEVHPLTGAGFCEREDEGHVFKRIAQSLRQGGPIDIQLERFVEAVHDTSSGLTYSALSGVRKQSVQDVERLFSESLIRWMENKGYAVEAKFLQVIRNWRRASDERGLTDDLMPWHTDEGLRDFSLLEVNRSINNIQGISRETLVALIANIESKEWRCKFCSRNNLPSEHPHASSTDDVECFFSVLRDSVGKDFTLKEVCCMLIIWQPLTHS
ncbi:uncharacterized protein [Dysidea avara]|uniref:uncharacterized protein isoform X2 n=1 Tax=Dysidea avara TaxID=196820 RepID=UPI00332B0077